MQTRAPLFLLDRVRSEPPLRLEEPWHAAAIDLAGMYVGAFGDPTTSWYSKGPGIRFLAEALKVLARENGDPKTTHDPETIRKVIEGAKPLKAVSSTG